MQVLSVRVLAVFCSLILALPQGWCCVASTCMNSPVQTPTSKQQAPRCPCCPEPVEQPDQAPAKQPISPHCPSCTSVDRLVVPPQLDAVEVIETGCLLFVPPLPLVAPDLGHAIVIAESVDPPTHPSRQVLNCVWRC
jgi:hypothetical protein